MCSLRKACVHGLETSARRYRRGRGGEISRAPRRGLQRLAAGLALGDKNESDAIKAPTDRPVSVDWPTLPASVPAAVPHYQFHCAQCAPAQRQSGGQWPSWTNYAPPACYASRSRLPVQVAAVSKSDFSFISLLPCWRIALCGSHQDSFPLLNWPGFRREHGQEKKPALWRAKSISWRRWRRQPK